ncbi:MAG: hypothetical protein WC455_31145 [Dehalococcoidia bacterium]
MSKAELPKFGSSVEASALYKRIHRVTEKQGSGYLIKTSRKIWERKPAKISGIYIGYRTLCDGKREWEDEAGYIFFPELYFPAALIAEGPRKRPVLVPVDSIRVLE